MTDRQKTRQRPNPRRVFGQSYGAVLAEGVNRRSVLKGFLGASAIAAMGSIAPRPAHAAENVSSLKFEELTRVRDNTDHWPEGYDRQVPALGRRHLRRQP